MKGVCQSCGAVAPLEWFLADGKYKQCLTVMAIIPREVAAPTVRYLGLFRPASGRAMSVDKALRLLEEIAALVKAGHVQVDKLVARPCPPRIWAEAMEQMRENPKLRLPMKSHNYLKSVAYDLADAADAGAERRVREAEQSGVRPVPRPEEESGEPADGLLPIERQMQQRGLNLPAIFKKG